ncbi:hypothetical protein SUDANB180_03884 [Streptomyces sp. enrichment culture]
MGQFSQFARGKRRQGRPGTAAVRTLALTGAVTATVFAAGQARRSPC